MANKGHGFKHTKGGGHKTMHAAPGHSLHHTAPVKQHSLRQHVGAKKSGSHHLRHHLAK